MLKIRFIVALFVVCISFFICFTAFSESIWVCPACGSENSANFCENCGEKKPVIEKANEDNWICPACGTESTSNFCGNCGEKKPVAKEPNEDNWTCPDCGTENSTKYCKSCGYKKPAMNATQEPTLKPTDTPTPKPTPEPTPESTAAYATDPIHNPFVPVFMLSSKETIDLSNYMCYGGATISGKFYFGVMLKNKKFAGIGKMLLANISDKAVLLKGQISAFINVNQGWLYYINCSKKNQYTIEKMTISGENKTTLVKPSEGELQWMFIYNDRIYYAVKKEVKNGTDRGGLYSVNLNGSGKQTILSKPVDCPYILNGQLLYADSNDKGRLHICDIDGKNDSMLIDDNVCNWVTDGNSIYYLKENSSERCVIRSYDLKSKEIKTIISDDVSYMGMHDDFIYYSNKDDAGRLYSYNIYTGNIDVLAQDKNTTPICFGETGLFFSVSGNKGGVTAMYFIDYDTYRKVDISR